MERFIAPIFFHLEDKYSLRSEEASCEQEGSQIDEFLVVLTCTGLNSDPLSVFQIHLILFLHLFLGD